ncbi:hypothetical protein GOP47_0007961 [Adiantum capillus-veneris]|uniref:Thioredoxin domain-containing protein n=1 Tax=Adiantum capillus-veneris TaxID=13818 RepID=A0A9D4V2L2_ADICA|nr:hypothetical protein GOP47_0007961 [Adiantum capillus-veneris]
MATLCSPGPRQAPSGRSIIKAPSGGRSLRPSSSIRCAPSIAVSAPASAAPAGLLVQLHEGAQSGLLQCPAVSPVPRTFEGDWNSRMLFNRGLDTVKAVDKDSLWSALEDAGDKPVVLDMYSRWCGPCRLIYPKLVKLSEKYSDVVFLKLDCTSQNKTVFSHLGVGLLPTFKIFKNSSLVSQVKGAKYDELVAKIEKARIMS